MDPQEQREAAKRIVDRRMGRLKAVVLSAIEASGLPDSQREALKTNVAYAIGDNWAGLWNDVRNLCGWPRPGAERAGDSKPAVPAGQ